MTETTRSVGARVFRLLILLAVVAALVLVADYLGGGERATGTQVNLTHVRTGAGSLPTTPPQ